MLECNAKPMWGILAEYDVQYNKYMMQYALVCTFIMLTSSKRRFIGF